MPSFLSLLRGRNVSNMMPRFWIAPNYEPLQRDTDGLAWELKGQGVRCLTEQDFVDDSGQMQHSGKADPTAQKWADSFTKKFDELSHEDSTFGQLRNVMDLAVIGALNAKERLAKKSGFAAPNLMGEQAIAEFTAPRSVPSQASKVGRMVSVSGGVQIFPWQVADRTQVSHNLAATHGGRLEEKSWYWQR
jgi:hypothetical protein